MPSASYVISSLAEKQSCNSITSTSSIEVSASASARSAAYWDMSQPTTLIELPSSNVDGMSVTSAWPAISIAWSHSPCSSTNRSEAITAQPEPSEVGEHCSLVSGLWII